MKNNFSNSSPIQNLYKRKDLRSKLETQLLYGDKFKVLKKYGEWKRIKIKKDGYVGYIKSKSLSRLKQPNFKISVLKAKIYSSPKTSKGLKKFLPFESRVKIIRRSGKFGKFGKFWIKFSDLKRLNFKDKKVFKNIELFKNIKYLWGGKSYKGIDCSALVQIFFNQNNKYCPRDSKDQEKFFKKKVKLKNIRKNDMIFWRGHVAVVLSRNELIHAYGPMKKVVIMNIKKTIERIYKTANLKVTSIRRA